MKFRLRNDSEENQVSLFLCWLFVTAVSMRSRLLPCSYRYRDFQVLSRGSPTPTTRYARNRKPIHGTSVRLNLWAHILARDGVRGYYRCSLGTGAYRCQTPGHAFSQSPTVRHPKSSEDSIDAFMPPLPVSATFSLLLVYMYDILRQ